MDGWTDGWMGRWMDDVNFAGLLNSLFNSISVILCQWENDDINNSGIEREAQTWSDLSRYL